MKPTTRSPLIGKYLLAAGLTTCLVGSPIAAAHANCTSQSPTAYTSPLEGSSNEAAQFAHLQKLRDSGHLSPEDYQKQVMELAAGTKTGMAPEATSPCEDVIPAPVEPQQAPQSPAVVRAFQPIPPSHAPQITPKPALPSWLLKKVAGRQIQRPTGTVLTSVETKDFSIY